MSNPHLLQLELHSRTNRHDLLGCRQVARVSQRQVRDVGVVSQLPRLRVEDQETFIEEDAIGGLLGDQAVGQEVSVGESMSESRDDLFELAGVGGRALGAHTLWRLCSFKPLFHCYNNRSSGHHDPHPYCTCS